MLASEHRLRSSALFRTVVKRGSRKGSRTVVVHLWTPTPVAVSVRGAVAGAALPPHPESAPGVPVATFGGPRVGLVVSKAVGNAVVRHAVSRRLRAAADAIIREDARAESPLLRPHSFLVVRALPASADARTEEVEADVRRCLRRLCP